MAKEQPLRVNTPEACVDEILRRVGNRVTLGLPLGLGKPVRLVNALYQRARDNPRIQLHIVTAISLLAPVGRSGLERRFLEPFVARVYAGVPELAYARDVAAGKLPDNVRVSEFFFRAGGFLNHGEQQRHFICTNYTHAVRDLLALGVNVVTQLVAPPSDAMAPVVEGEPALSLSCNPDLTLDLLPELRRQAAAGTPIAVAAEINRRLPYLGNDAAVPESAFDMIFERQRDEYPLFPVPQMSVSPVDHLIGFYASALLKDGGTLQVGIGSLGAAVVHSTILRHRHNATWRRVHEHLGIDRRFPVATREGGTGVFEQGLYGCSEMLVDGFLHLLKAGVLTRQVFDDAQLQELINAGRISPEVSLATLDQLVADGLVNSPLRARDVQWLQRYGILRPEVVFRGGRLVLGEISLDPDLDDGDTRDLLVEHMLGTHLSGGVVVHGGFYLGPADFYEQLRGLSPRERAMITMTSVNYINDLYDHRFGRQRLKVAQRTNARFINSAMMQTLSGAAVSDGLEDGRVVSGVGGQYNFVAMAHDLPGARSVITLRSTRESGGRTVSNIVFSYGHCTIPRHLRDIVVTEYGIADLRGRSDEEVYLALIAIADARFQPGLLKQAQKAGKVAADFRLPGSWTRNTPGAVTGALQAAGGDAFPGFPFGCDFRAEELALGKALQAIKTATATTGGKLRTLWQAIREPVHNPALAPYLERMALARPDTMGDRLNRRLLALGLRRTGAISERGDNTD